MPRGRHVAGATPRENRMYEKILRGYRAAGRPAAWARQMAARTVNAYRARKGETKAKSRRGR
jgi:hypothetical protein